MQVKETRPNFFLLKKIIVVHTNKHVEHPPQNFPRGAPLPLFPFYFPFSFGSELAGGRAGGRGFPFLGFTGPVRGTTRGREPRPGSPTGAIAHTPPGAETRTVEALPGDGVRPPGRTPARARGGRGRKGRRTVVHACAAAGAFAATGQSATVALVIGLRFVLFGLVCFLLLLVLFLNTGDHGWVGGWGEAGGAARGEELRRIQKPDEKFLIHQHPLLFCFLSLFSVLLL